MFTNLGRNHQSIRRVRHKLKIIYGATVRVKQWEELKTKEMNYIHSVKIQTGPHSPESRPYCYVATGLQIKLQYPKISMLLSLILGLA